MNLLKLFFVGIFLISFNLQAAQSSGPFETLQQIRQGMQGGFYDNLSPDQKIHFTDLLNDARDVLFSSSSQLQVACISQGSGYYIVSNLDTGKTYGQSLYGLQACKDTLAEPGNPYMCLHQGSGYFSLANLSTGKIFGQSLYGLASCKEAIPAVGQKFACVHQGSGYWVVTNLQTGVTLGTSVYGLSACKAQLP